MDKDDKYICVRCNAPVPGDHAELVGMRIFCQSCAKAYKDDKDDKEIEKLLKHHGPS